MTNDLVKRLRGADEYEPLGRDAWEAADRISALEAALAKADELDAISEMLLRMMDDVLRPTGKGDMAIVPDGSVGVISAWKTLTAYRQARDATR